MVEEVNQGPCSAVCGNCVLKETEGGGELCMLVGVFSDAPFLAHFINVHGDVHFGFIVKEGCPVGHSVHQVRVGFRPVLGRIPLESSERCAPRRPLNAILWSGRKY